MVNFGSLAAEIGPVVWGTPANFNGLRVLAALKPNSIMLAGSQLVGDQLRTSFEPDSVMEFGFYCTVLQQWAPPAKLCGVEQRAPPIFGRAAITLGIGPHSSSFFLSTFFPRLISAVADWMSPILPHMVWP